MKRMIPGWALLLTLVLAACQTTYPAYASHRLKGGGTGQAQVSMIVGGSYPAGVVAHDAATGDTSMRQVYDLMGSKPGPRIALTPVASYSAPTGSSFSSGGTAFTTTGSPAISGVDFTGNGVYVTGDGQNPTFTDVQFGPPNPAAGYTVETGQTSGGGPGGSPTISASYCMVDEANETSGHAGGVAADINAVLHYDHCTFKNAARDYIIFGSPDGSHSQTFVGSWLYFGAYGTSTTNGDHLEFIHQLSGGLMDLSYSFFNYVDGMGSTPDGPGTNGGVSGAFQIQSDNAAINETLHHIIIFGAKTFKSHDINGNLSVGVLGSISCKAVNFDVTLHLHDMILQAGPTGKYGVATNLNGHTCNFVNDGNNFDYDTGLPIISFT